MKFGGQQKLFFCLTSLNSADEKTSTFETSFDFSSATTCSVHYGQVFIRRDPSASVQCIIFLTSEQKLHGKTVVKILK